MGVAQETTTHATLLARLSSGSDTAAWREFCGRYGAVIRGFARRYGLQPADCDDVVQDVLVSLAQSMPGFRYDPSRGKFRSYLKTVVVHAIFRRKRQNRPDAVLGEMGLALEASDERAETLWETEWRQYHIGRAMQVIEREFNAVDRAAFDGYAVEGIDAREVAGRLALSVDQVYQAKSRILRRLGELIASQVEEEG